MPTNEQTKAKSALRNRVRDVTMGYLSTKIINDDHLYGNVIEADNEFLSSCIETVFGVALENPSHRSSVNSITDYLFEKGVRA